MTSCLGAPADLLAAVESYVAMTTGDVDPDDVPLRQTYGVVGSYPRRTRAAIVAATVRLPLHCRYINHSVAEWLACLTQEALKGIGSNRSRDAVG